MKLLTLICALTAAALGMHAGSAAAQNTPPIDDLTELLPSGAAVSAAAAPSSSSGGGSEIGVVSGNRGSASAKRLAIGFADLRYQADAATSNAVFNETVQVNAGVVRLSAVWRAIAPATRGSSFDARNPASPGYNWSGLDTAVQQASARGLRVILLINGAPDWAEGSGRPASAAEGTWKPNPGDIGDFGAAIAKHYSGALVGVPQVKDFQFWAEPNLESNLTPVWTGKNGKSPAAPLQYRKMLNAFYEGVHGAGQGNNVITGGTAPYGSDPGVMNMRPLLFWRQVLCVKDDKRLSPAKCPEKPKFDVLAHHPINTSGGPGTSAINDDDVSTPDLHNLVDVLRAAEKAGNVQPKGKRPVWATEIWWESNPPDPAEVNPSTLVQARWYQQSLYSLWSQGASMVLFLQVRDEVYNGTPGRFEGNFQTGVFFADGRAKLAARAVSFPFVANRKSKRDVLLWGIAPESGKVVVTNKGKGSGRVAAFKVKRGRIFTETIKLRQGKGKYKLKAQVGNDKSLNWSVK